jgi:hypothetical protein
MLALPVSAKTGPVASASKCKKAKKGKHKKKKKKKCGSSPAAATLPGQATHPTATPPVAPPAVTVSSVSVTDNPVLVGRSTQGQVTIGAPAPAGGQPVDLQSTFPSASVPASVYVAPGLTTATFTVTTNSAGTTTLVASVAGSNASTPLNVVSAPSVSSVVLDHQCYPGPGAFPLNRVTLDVAAPADTPVDLLSDSASLTVPSQVVVPLGSKSALFSVTAGAATTSPATVTASLSLSQASDSASVLDASSPPPGASTLTLSPSTVVASGQSTGTVTLDCEAPSGGAAIDLSSADPTNVTVPAAPVTVPAGSLSTTFPITTNASAPDGTYDISATAEAGGVTRHTTLTIASTLPD